MKCGHATWWTRANNDLFDTYIFDCDGVLWRGSHILPGALETLTALRERGKRVLFLTNNSTKSREQYKEKLRSLGIEADTNHIYSSSFAAAAYLKSIAFKHKAFVIGEATGIVDELDIAEIPYTTARRVLGPSHYTTAQLEAMEMDPAIGAVVMGLDYELTFSKLTYATILLQEQHCLFVSTNQDASFPNTKHVLPGTGAGIAALETATGRKAINVGKPEAFLLDHIVSTFGLDRSRTLMVGDRLSTDITFGMNGGIQTLLVLTGITKQDEVESGRSTIVPDYIAQSVESILKPE